MANNILITAVKKITDLTSATVINNDDSFIIALTGNTKKVSLNLLKTTLSNSLGIESLNASISELKSTTTNLTSTTQDLLTLIDKIKKTDDTVAGKNQLGKIALASDPSQWTSTKLPLLLTEGKNEAYIDVTSIDSSGLSTKIKEISVDCLKNRQMLVDDEKALADISWNPQGSIRYKLSSVQTELYELKDYEEYSNETFELLSNYTKSVCCDLSVEMIEDRVSIDNNYKQLTANTYNINAISNALTNIVLTENTIKHVSTDIIYLNNTIITLSDLFLSSIMLTSGVITTEIYKNRVYDVKLSSSNSTNKIYDILGLSVEANDKLMLLEDTDVSEITVDKIFKWPNLQVEVKETYLNLSINVTLSDETEDKYLSTYIVQQGSALAGQSINIPKYAGKDTDTISTVVKCNEDTGIYEISSVINDTIIGHINLQSSIVSSIVSENYISAALLALSVSNDYSVSTIPSTSATWYALSCLSVAILNEVRNMIEGI